MGTLQETSFPKHDVEQPRQPLRNLDHEFRQAKWRCEHGFGSNADLRGAGPVRFLRDVAPRGRRSGDTRGLAGSDRCNRSIERVDGTDGHRNATCVRLPGGRGAEQLCARRAAVQSGRAWRCRLCFRPQRACRDGGHQHAAVAHSTCLERRRLNMKLEGRHMQGRQGPHRVPEQWENATRDFVTQPTSTLPAQTPASLEFDARSGRKRLKALEVSPQIQVSRRHFVIRAFGFVTSAETRQLSSSESSTMIPGGSAGPARPSGGCASPRADG